VEVRDVWIEKGEGVRGFGDAASHQKFGQYERQASGFGECCRLVRMRLREAPTLTRDTTGRRSDFAG
jgi:hypothetical protein